ncbi:MAG: DUF1285 domain-containing protein [Gammaproteobacteria bacterium]|nr:DUF1285 domain-containing protein [Gammaproteobacteria bacterium]
MRLARCSRALRRRRATEALPPVARWHPERSGDSDIAIDRHGQWHYRGSLISRPEMVRLFSTILRRDTDGFVLVTPVEKLYVAVEDAPFIATALEQRGTADAAELAFLTNVGDVVIADREHPIDVRVGEKGPKPYVRVRGGLDALIARPVYYALIALGEEREPGRLSVMSAGCRFTIGDY